MKILFWLNLIELQLNLHFKFSQARNYLKPCIRLFETVMVGYAFKWLEGLYMLYIDKFEGFLKEKNDSFFK